MKIITLFVFMILSQIDCIFSASAIDAAKARLLHKNEQLIFPENEYWRKLDPNINTSEIDFTRYLVLQSLAKGQRTNFLVKKSWITRHSSLIGKLSKTTISHIIQLAENEVTTSSLMIVLKTLSEFEKNGRLEGKTVQGIVDITNDFRTAEAFKLSPLGLLDNWGALKNLQIFIFPSLIDHILNHLWSMDNPFTGISNDIFKDMPKFLNSNHVKGMMDYVYRCKIREQNPFNSIFFLVNKIFLPAIIDAYFQIVKRPLNDIGSDIVYVESNDIDDSDNTVTKFLKEIKKLYNDPIQLIQQNGSIEPSYKKLINNSLVSMFQSSAIETNNLFNHYQNGVVELKNYIQDPLLLLENWPDTVGTHELIPTTIIQTELAKTEEIPPSVKKHIEGRKLYAKKGMIPSLESIQSMLQSLAGEYVILDLSKDTSSTISPSIKFVVINWDVMHKFEQIKKLNKIIAKKPQLTLIIDFQNQSEISNGWSTNLLLFSASFPEFEGSSHSKIEPILDVKNIAFLGDQITKIVGQDFLSCFRNLTSVDFSRLSKAPQIEGKPFCNGTKLTIIGMPPANNSATTQYNRAYSSEQPTTMNHQ